MAITLERGRWRIAFTDRTDGDFQFASPGVDQRRVAVVGERPVVWLRQVHGNAVVLADGHALSPTRVGCEADAVVGAMSPVAMSVVTADCAPIALVAGDVAAAIHAGWKGLVNGVIDAAVGAVRDRIGPDEPIHAWLGPCIHPSSYAFGEADLAAVANRLGPAVRSTTTDGHPALDMRAAVVAAAARVGVDMSLDYCADTAGPTFYSHRVRRDPERQALFVWSDPS